MSANSPIFSFEFFPPPADGFGAFAKIVQWYTGFDPAFMDVTYGAGGGAVAGQGVMLKATFDTIAAISENAPGVPIIVHVPNNRFDKIGLTKAIDCFWLGKKINEYMPMFGDGPPLFPGQGFATTEDLITGLCVMTKKLPGAKRLELTLTVEPERSDAVERLKAKIAAIPAQSVGKAKAVRAVMQYSYNTETILAFPEKVKKASIDIDIVPGFMPIGSSAESKNRPDNISPHRDLPGVMVDGLGVTVPAEVTAAFEKIKDKGPEAMREFAVEIAAAQIRKIKNAGVGRFHFFAANRRLLTQAVIEESGLHEFSARENLQKRTGSTPSYGV